jgi:iron-sulfur cluster repair protein YtfE (RIC family)
MTNEAVSVFFPAAVRDRILEQHGVLRELLRQSLDATTRAFQPDGPGVDELARLIHDLRSRFWAHLAFEERTLLPILEQLDPWGPERVADLRDEHARQRAELDTLVEGIESAWGNERLAVTLRSLATDLLIDMEDEERGCLDSRLLRDEMVLLGNLDE